MGARGRLVIAGASFGGGQSSPGMVATIGPVQSLPQPLFAFVGSLVPQVVSVHARAKRCNDVIDVELGEYLVIETKSVKCGSYFSAVGY